MVNKAQKAVNKALKKAGGKRSIMKKSPITKTRRAWNFTIKKK